MSIFERIFGRLAEQKAEVEARRQATLEDVHSCIVRGVVNPPKAEKDIAADQAIIENAIVNGLITEERVKLLVDKALMLRSYLADGETECPPVDFEECQATIAKANAMIAAARRKVTDAQSTAAMVRDVRGHAQALILEVPEIGEQIARAMKASWNPRVCPVTGRKLNDVAPQNHANNEDESNAMQSAASVLGSVEDV